MALPSQFNRNYELTVQVTGGTAVVIVPPMRVSFSANKAADGGLNKLTISIYNLSAAHRLALSKDAEDSKRVAIALRVGYRDTMPVLFKGTVFRGTNSRAGADMVTVLECLDGGADFLSGFISSTVKGKARGIDAVLDGLPNTGKGKLTSAGDVIRPLVLVGSPARLLDGLTEEDESWYVDDEQLFILKRDEVTSSYIPVINAASGLLNTPSRQMQKVTFETLMSPALRIGGLCQLESVSAPQMDGIYKIYSIGYNGDNYGSTWSQSVTGLLLKNYKVI